jgi:2-succinyl-6-hydroxy-2,4-cyclohexadiene-1-carboxylate synthase
VGAAFSAYPRLYIDLPGHGGSREVRVSGLPRSACGWQKTLAHYHVRDYWLIGYSLGGRIAMFLPASRARLCGLVVEGGHPACRMRNAASALAAMPPGRSVFVASRWRRFCRLVPAAGFRQLKYAAAEALVALRSQQRRQSGRDAGGDLPAVQPDLRAQLRARRYPFIIFAASAMRSFAPLRATSPPRHILFIMPGITRIGKIPRRWCHVWRSFAS